MTDPKYREGRIKLEVLLRTADRERLERCCSFVGLSMTRFITNRIREHERKTLQRLNEEQRELYLAGDLIWDEMGEEAHDAFVLHVGPSSDERLKQATLSEVLGKRTE
jgi:hypothetical protein